VTLRRALSADIVFLFLVILAILAAGSGTSYIIQRQKNTAIVEALNRSSFHTRAFESHLTGTLETVQRLADYIAAGSAETAPEIVDELFRRTLRQAPFLRSLSMIDATGRIVASSNSGNVGHLLDAGEYFPSVTPSLHPHLRIGRPWTGRDFDEGAPAVAEQSHPVIGLGFVPVLCRGEYKGREVQLAVALNADYFINYFSQWLTASDGFVEILRYDRVVLLTSGEASAPGKIHPDRLLAQMLLESEIGHYQGDGGGQGQALTAFRVSRQFPLLVVTHLRRDQALANWRQESGRLVLLVGLVLAGLLYLATVLYRRERRMAAEREAVRRREYERLAATVFETVLEAVMVTDADQRVIAVNPAFTRITGYSAEEAVGADFSLLASGYHNEAFFQAVEQSLATQGHWEGEMRNRRKTGEIFVAWLSINQVRDDTGHVLYLVAGFSDITEYCAEADRISHLAHHDLLTGLPNRALLLDRLGQGLHQAHREGGQLALLYFDLDKFKPVNDTLGHTVGDRLLQALAERVLGVVRSSDTLARLGGDEFVVLLPVIKRSRAATVVAEKICQAVAQPFQIEAHRIEVTASIGIALYPDHASKAEGLMQGADKAMYRAKAQGGNRFELYRA
jgi:diguanylate cyclase (GGDEF)-like protein/PAS domain S-box-containing protein